MRLLIDGYNLLHATDLFGAGELAGTLRGSREALLAFLAERLSTHERAGTVVVFDSADAPSGLADEYEHGGMSVRFARGYPDADAMIEALLEGVHRARGLTVVSGDRRVQRAARSSGAGWIDSDAWFDALCRREATPATAASDRPTGNAGTPAEWVGAFSDPEALSRIEEQAAAAPPPVPKPERTTPEPAAEESAEPTPARPRRKKRRPPLSEGHDKPPGGFAEGVRNPFPDGYADDLLETDDDPDGDAGRAESGRG